ncbi:MAG: radical SAM protein [Elusimicrobiota bacterium]|nr:radical SAM protein [Elusimicrobiota bacterium]
MSPVLAERRMLDVFLNYACQAKCPFCYNPELTPELVRWKLSLEQVAQLLVAERAKGYDGVTFSGGEVTLLKELPAMLKLARKAGYEEAGIITNGLLLADPGYAGLLREAGLTFACVSIHGADAGLHDKMVEVPGAFEKVLSALDNLRGIPLVLNFVLTAENMSCLPDFIRRFAPDDRFHEIQVYLPHYEGLMADNQARLRLKVADAKPVLKAAVLEAERLAAGHKVRIYNAPPCTLPEFKDRLRNWAREEGESLLVDPAGMKENAFAQERRARVKPEACASCSLDAVCLGFEAPYAERWGLGEAVPFAS